MIIETERLLLRPVYGTDIPDIYTYSQEPEVGPNAGWKPHESLEETSRIANEIFIGQEGVFGVILKEENRLIGTAGIIPDIKRSNESAGMLGYAIGKSYWGKGLMTEAAKALLIYGFHQRGLSLITAYCYPHNTRSVRVIQKCCFRYEGMLRQSERLYDGSVLDELCYSMTKEEFEQLSR